MKIESSYINLESSRTYEESRTVQLALKDGMIRPEEMGLGEDSFDRVFGRMLGRDQEDSDPANTSASDKANNGKHLGWYKDKENTVKAIEMLSEGSDSGSATPIYRATANELQNAMLERVRSLFEALESLIAQRLQNLSSDAEGAEEAAENIDESTGEIIADATSGDGDNLAAEGGGVGSNTEAATPAEEGGKKLLARFGREGASAVEVKAKLSYYERETTTFRSHGIVRTEDGVEFDFGVDVTMERESAQRMEMSLLLDPLVVNYDAPAAELTSNFFDFDLDGDGETEGIASLGEGSGYLALDGDGDGIINDGSELFGALSGNGFGDLSAYDEDGNGWIDENDSLFDKLSIWSRDAAGNDCLTSLTDCNIGALYLGNTGTDFSLDQNGEALGQVRRSGLGLREDYSSFTIQQIDLSVQGRNSYSTGTSDEDAQEDDTAVDEAVAVA